MRGPLYGGSQVRTILLVYLRLHVEVDACDDDVGEHVEGAHAVEHIRILKGHLLGDLHKPPIHILAVRVVVRWCARDIQDDDKIGDLRAQLLAF